MLTLFHDFTSPASWVAVRRLERLAADGLPVEFVGFEAIGIDMVLPATLDVLAEWEAVRDAAATEGIEMQRPTRLPPTGLAHVVAELADTERDASSWRERCYRAYWEDDADLADAEVLVGLAEDAGWDPEHVRAVLDDRLALAEVRRRTTGHRREGVGGVPTLLAHRTLVPGLLDEQDLRALASL
ncbi:MAG: DsbA family oxidoreductase [Egibacteraceae bacterium]